MPEVICRRGGANVSPFGKIVAGPLYDQNGILYADLDMAEVTRGKFDFDVVGHYLHPDIFQLKIDERAQNTVSLIKGVEQEN